MDRLGNFSDTEYKKVNIADDREGTETLFVLAYSVNPLRRSPSNLRNRPSVQEMLETERKEIRAGDQAPGSL